MGKIILNLAVTLDGYIAGPNGEYDWCLTDADYGMTNFLKSVDCLLMGRKTYDLVLQYGPPYPEKTIYVFSRTLKKPDFDNVVIVDKNIPSFIYSLKRTSQKNSWLFGGAEIIYLLSNHGLIDEMVLSVHPVLLGNGIPLFKNEVRRNLMLTDLTQYPSGLVQLTYQNAPSTNSGKGVMT